MQISYAFTYVYVELNKTNKVILYQLFVVDTYCTLAKSCMQIHQYWGPQSECRDLTPTTCEARCVPYVQYVHVQV